MIVPVYEAKTLFANIDQIVTAAFTFMMDLDRATPETVADVCLKHVCRLKRVLADDSYLLALLILTGHTSENRTNRRGCFRRWSRSSLLLLAISR